MFDPAAAAALEGAFDACGRLRSSALVGWITGGAGASDAAPGVPHVFPVVGPGFAGGAVSVRF